MRDLAERCMHRSEDQPHAAGLGDAHVRPRQAAHAPPGPHQLYQSHARRRFQAHVPTGPSSGRSDTALLQKPLEFPLQRVPVWDLVG
jgi:hypothetical protein